MGENKEYMTQELENGAIHISEEVIASIAAMAVNEVEGVCGLSANIGSDIAEMLGKKSISKGIRLSVDADNHVSIVCNVICEYGHSVVDVAKSVQNSVTAAVESMTGMDVGAVNVNICGISIKK